jgi:hypothetical protein
LSTTRVLLVMIRRRDGICASYEGSSEFEVRSQ